MADLSQAPENISVSFRYFREKSICNGDGFRFGIQIISDNYNKFHNICKPLNCPDTKSTGPSPQQNPYQNESPKYPMPNVQPTVLVEINKCIEAIAWNNGRLRELVKDASAGLGTPYFDANRRPAFPVLVPQASFRRK